MPTRVPAEMPGPGDLPAGGPGKWRFLLGQNAQGLWVIRECAGAKAGLFLTREAALRFARLECFEDDYAVIQLSEGLEFDYAA